MAKTKVRRRKIVSIRISDPGQPPLFLRVLIRNAKRPITMRSTFAEALAGKPGENLACRFALCAEHNRVLFPHDFVMASFTKSTAIIVDEIKKGRCGKYEYDATGVRYAHRLSTYVDLNDEDKDKEIIKNYPELMEMKVGLYVPQMRASQAEAFKKYLANGGTRLRERSTNPKSPKVMRGALARAVKAGLISPPVAQILKRT